MLSNKPYLIRAFYEWIVDSGCTPYLVVNANYPRCCVPQQHVENGEITLNISPQAVHDLSIAAQVIEFQASFSGVVHMISAPIQSVLAIYAQENQQGMFFDYEEFDETEESFLNRDDTQPFDPFSQSLSQDTSSQKNKKPGKPYLQLVE